MGGLGGLSRLGGLLAAALALGWTHPVRACPIPEPPTVVGGIDRDGDGRFTGHDLELGLRACSKAGGCVLQLFNVTYDDVAILLYNGAADAAACDAARTACLDLPFPNGLVIRGTGAATVLRSPLWARGVRPEPVIELWRRSDIPFRLEQLVLDGRGAEQPGGAPDDRDAWVHTGLSSWHHFDVPAPHSHGCVRNVTMRGFLSRGILLERADGWVIEDNLIEDIGCWEGLTQSCPLLADMPDLYGIPGHKVGGMGIMIGRGVQGLVLRRNVVRRSAKYGIAFKHHQDGLTSSIRWPLVEDNVVERAGSVGLFIAGVRLGTFSRNRILFTDRVDPPELRHGYTAFGISCGGRVEATQIVDSEISDSSGIGLGYHCTGFGNRIADTVFARSCRVKNPDTCVPGTNQCYDYADLNLGMVNQGEGSLELDNVRVENSRCAQPLRVIGDPQNPFFLSIRGGELPAGSQPTEFRDVLLELGPAE